MWREIVPVLRGSRHFPGCTPPSSLPPVPCQPRSGHPRNDSPKHRCPLRFLLPLCQTCLHRTQSYHTTLSARIKIVFSQNSCFLSVPAARETPVQNSGYKWSPSPRNQNMATSAHQKGAHPAADCQAHAENWQSPVSPASQNTLPCWWHAPESHARTISSWNPHPSPPSPETGARCPNILPVWSPPSPRPWPENFPLAAWCAPPPSLPRSPSRNTLASRSDLCDHRHSPHHHAAEENQASQSAAPFCKCRPRPSPPAPDRKRPHTAPPSRHTRHFRPSPSSAGCI